MQPTIRCAFSHTEIPPHTCLSTWSCCCGMLHPKLIRARGFFVCLRELNPSVLQSCQTHSKWSLGCAKGGETDGP